MAEATDTQVQATTPQAQETPVTPVDEIQAKIDAAVATYKAELDKKQSEVRGLDKKIGELTKTLQTKDIEKMSDLEKAKFEVEQAKAEADEIRQTALTLKKQNLVVSKGLPIELAVHINGTTDEDISKALDIHLGIIETEVSKRFEKAKNEFYSGKPPVNGQAPAVMSLQTALDEAKKKGDIALATAIRRQATKDGTQLNG